MLATGCIFLAPDVPKLLLRLGLSPGLPSWKRGGLQGVKVIGGRDKEKNGRAGK